MLDGCRVPTVVDPLPWIGARVILRRLARNDLRAFQAYRNDDAVGRYQGWSAQTDAQALAFIEEMGSAPVFPNGAWLQLAVAEPGTDELIGDIGVCLAADSRSAELGFTISPRFQGRGLGTEAVGEAVALVFEQSAADRVVCVTDARNEASIRLLGRAGMRRMASAGATFRGAACVEHSYAVFRRGRG